MADPTTNDDSSSAGNGSWEPADASYGDDPFGGQWNRLLGTTSDTSASDANPPGSLLAGDPFHPFSHSGDFVVLPDGSLVPDENSPTGYLMSPVADLRPVAAAGLQAGTIDSLVPVAFPYLAASLGIHLGRGGIFDYQRRGNSITGYEHFPQFRDVSNFNIGLFGQQAGMSLDEMLSIAGAYANVFSNNANSNQPNGLDPVTAQFIESGYDIGRSGVFNPMRIYQGGG